MTICWQCHTFASFTPYEVYALLAARQSVFVVEQTCAYQDIDSYDIDAEHVIGWSGSNVAAALRLIGPGIKFIEPSLGRIFTTGTHRGTGLGRELMQRGLARMQARFPDCAIRIGAQSYLENFYGEFGFVIASAPYLEDGIPHIEMLRVP